MKKIILTLVLAAATVINVCAMSKYRASREARFLTDKMAWELDLSYGQMEDVYEINYDYFRALDNVYDKYSWAYDIRNEELSYVLSPRQWKRFIAIEYFYVPVRVYRHAWVFPVHNHYHTDHFYYDAPHAYSHYSGAHAHNRDFYRGRFDNHHKFDHDNGRRPHSSGNVYHNAPAPRPNGNHAPAPKPNKNQHNAVPNRGGNNSRHDSAPVRNNPNRGGSNSRAESQRQNDRRQNDNSSARPTRSQNAQNSGSRTVTSGRR